MNERIFWTMLLSCVPSLAFGDQLTRVLTAMALLVVTLFYATIGREK